MTTASNASSPATAQTEPFFTQKTTSGSITVLTISGTVNESFDGEKLAASLKTNKVVVKMRDVRRFASWGMSEWMNFLRVAADKDIYLVECSTYSVSQINLITGLLGHAKLVSFYASYRCGSCSEEIESLFIIPSERQRIRALPGSHQECPTCGGRAWLEEYPASFFETIADRPPFDIDDEALAYMRTQLLYNLSPDLTRFRAYRRANKAFTYLRLTGNIAALPPDVLANVSQGTTIVDLDGVVFDPSQLTGWFTYVQAAMAKASSLQLMNCPAGFLEHGVLVKDLRHKLKVRSFSLPYQCTTCATTTPRLVDVAEQLEDLVRGIAPDMRCTTCRSQMIAGVTAQDVQVMHALPARDRDAALDMFLAKTRSEPLDKLENALTAATAKAPAAPSSSRALQVALGIGVVLLGGLGLVGYGVWKNRAAPVTNPTTTATGTGETTPPKPTFQRPEWITSDVPSSAYCHDMINRVICVGVSSYRGTRDEALAEATEAALEELVTAVGLKMTDPFIKDTVLPSYSEIRAKALGALQAAELDRTSKDPAALAAYTASAELVRAARKRVVDFLRVSGGAAVPTQHADWYWEEYADETGKSTETLVFVKYDVSLDAVRALVDKYSAATPVLGSSAVTAFPALAWKHPTFTGGAVLAKAAKPFSSAGVTPQQIITAVGDQPVTDATSFARKVQEASSGPLKVSVLTSDARSLVVSVPR